MQQHHLSLFWPSPRLARQNCPHRSGRSSVPEKRSG
jgi:hypothetical protein